MADGPNSLTDGIRGTLAIGRYWHGISGQVLIATVDLGSVTNIHQVSIGCLHKYSDWIFLPQSVRFEISEDGTTFRGIGTVNNDKGIDAILAIHNFSVIAPAGTQARYIRISAKNNLSPPGHPGQGKPGWIFADEMVVE